MTGLSYPGTITVPPLPAPEPGGRELWLVLSGDDQAAALPVHTRSVDILVVGDARDFERRLLELSPSVVVCSEPPADEVTLALVAAERRRRGGLRAVHLAPPDAVAARLASLDAGFDDALSSAIPTAELAGRLAWLSVRAQARVAGGRLRVTPTLVLDQEARALWDGNTAVHLRPKEYALLCLLAGQPGHAFSRTELLGLVWGPDRSADTRTVDVHVRWLRAKIEPDPEHAVHLVTVRGTGYRFDPPR